MHRIFLLCFIVPGALGQVVIDGVCDYAAFDYVQDLNYTAMFGTWHQIARIGNQNETGDCSTLVINGTYANSTLQRVNFYLSEIVNKTEKLRQGVMTTSDIIKGVYMLNFADTGAVMDFVVSSTNYVGHAVLYSCYAYNVTKYVWGWQYHRNASLSTADQNALHQIAVNNTDLPANSSSWRIVNNSDGLCKNSAVILSASSHILTLLTITLIGKEFV